MSIKGEFLENTRDIRCRKKLSEINGLMHARLQDPDGGPHR